jgi:hypothetical protein
MTIVGIKLQSGIKLHAIFGQIPNLQPLLYLILVYFDGIYIFDVIGFHSYPSEAYQMGFLVLTLVDPELRLCHPKKGCYF